MPGRVKELKSYLSVEVCQHIAHNVLPKASCVPSSTLCTFGWVYKHQKVSQNSQLLTHASTQVAQSRKGYRHVLVGFVLMTISNLDSHLSNFSFQ